jgi:hypothetical protein
MTKKKTLKKGGCGCQKSDELIIKGGSTELYNNPYVNSLNSYELDPSDPSKIMSVRIQPNMDSTSFLSGGKKKSKTKKTKKTNKTKTKTKKTKTKKTKTKIKRRTIPKQKGGGDPVLISHNANQVSSFDTVSGINTTANIIRGTSDEAINSGYKFMNSQMPFI